MFIMKEFLSQKIIDRQKTQTRRPIRDGDNFIIHNGKQSIIKNNRLWKQVGRDYAITYGRAKRI